MRTPPGETVAEKRRDRAGGPSIRLHDLSSGTFDFHADALAGLRLPQKEIPSKYLYDERGSELFEEICGLDEYYPTRTEIGIMRRYGKEMAARLGPRCRVVEPGSGAGVKTRMLLDLLDDPVAYVPVEISREFLMRSVEKLAEAYPEIQMLPVCADFTRPFTLPTGDRGARRTVVFFPGSTIGNFPLEEIEGLLRNLAALCAGGGALLIGVDLKKDVKILEAAYNDRKGVTARFNLNLLTRMNRELGADFRVDRFEHHSFWNPERGCIEVHIRSLEAQTVRIGDATFPFRTGETLRTEYCTKFSVEEFAALSARAGLVVDRMWTDPERLFSVQLCNHRGTEAQREHREFSP